MVLIKAHRLWTVVGNIAAIRKMHFPRGPTETKKCNKPDTLLSWDQTQSMAVLATDHWTGRDKRMFALQISPVPPL